MRISVPAKRRGITSISARSRAGFTLIETVVFIVVVSIGLGAVLTVFNQFVVQSVDPLMRITALEKGQAMLDDILAQKFDDNTPAGGVPACGSAGGGPCAGIRSTGVLNSVGGYHGYSETDENDYHMSATVVEAGNDLGLSPEHARLITVTVTMPIGGAIHLSAYKVNL